MRAAPVSTTSKGKTAETNAAASTVQSEDAGNPTPVAAAEQANAAAVERVQESRPRRNKRRRMGKVVFGLAIHSSLNRLDDEEEAEDERHRRNRINHIQGTIERLRSSDPTWRYLESPRDFLVTISPSSESTATQ